MSGRISMLCELYKDVEYLSGHNLSEVQEIASAYLVTQRENAELRAAHELVARAHENRIERDMKIIAELRAEIERMAAKIKYYEETLCFPMAKPEWLEAGVTAQEVSPVKVQALLAEIERMRPVVEAANGVAYPSKSLARALREYEASK